MARLDPIEYDDLTPEQKVIHAKLASTRKRVGGPFAIWLRIPNLAHTANELTLALRENGKLEKRLFELIVLIVVRHWSAQYAWSAHEPNAVAAGLSPDVIAAIRERRKPDFKKADERMIYEAVSELLDTKELSAPTYDRLLKQFGLDTNHRSHFGRGLLRHGIDRAQGLRRADADRRAAV